MLGGVINGVATITFIAAGTIFMAAGDGDDGGLHSRRLFKRSFFSKAAANVVKSFVIWSALP